MQKDTVDYVASDHNVYPIICTVPADHVTKGKYSPLQYRSFFIRRAVQFIVNLF
jgi:hypothetical protein